MKKRVLTIFLTSIIFIATFIYMSPFSVWADYYFDNVIAWSINGISVSPRIFKSSNNVYSTVYSYSESTSWQQLSSQSTGGITYQLPSPIFSHNQITVTDTLAYRVQGNVTTDKTTTLAFDFNLGFENTLELLNPQSGDFVCLVVPFVGSQLITDIKFQWANIVSGNSYEPTDLFTDDRMLIFDPYNRSGRGTSGIIDSSLWSMPWSSSNYICLLYCNLPYDDLVYYGLPNGYIPSFSVDFDPNGGFNTYWFPPVFYKVSFNEDLTLLNNVNDNVQHIVDVMDSGTSFPIGSSTPDYSTMNQLEDQISSIASDSSIWTGLNDGFGSVEIIQGLAWVGSFITSYYNGLPFLKSIFALIILFEIWSILNGTFFNREQDETEWVYHTREHGTDSRG